jgi:hypothetical protein
MLDYRFVVDRRFLIFWIGPAVRRELSPITNQQRIDNQKSEILK